MKHLSYKIEVFFHQIPFVDENEIKDLRMEIDVDLQMLIKLKFFQVLQVPLDLPHLFLLTVLRQILLHLQLGFHESVQLVVVAEK